MPPKTVASKRTAPANLDDGGGSLKKKFDWDGKRGAMSRSPKSSSKKKKSPMFEVHPRMYNGQNTGNPELRYRSFFHEKDAVDGDFERERI